MSVTSSSGRFFGSEALLRKYSQSKIEIWILVELKWIFFYFFFLHRNRKAGKNHIRLSHRFGFVLKWNISNQVAFFAYPCKLLGKVILNCCQVCNLALQHFGLKMRKKMFFQHLWLIYLFTYRFFSYLTVLLRAGRSVVPSSTTLATTTQSGGGCFSMIRLDHLDLPALRKTYNKHIFWPL